MSWTTDFTITAWVFVKSRVACGKLLDCGIKGQNEIVINLSSCNGEGQAMQVYNNRRVSEFVYNRKRLEANKWLHLTFTLSQGKILLYTDGVLVANGTTNIKPNVKSNYGTCFIGKNLWNNPNINAYIDDLAMFNRGLSIGEIQQMMNRTTTTRTTSTSTSMSTSTTSTTTSTATSTSTSTELSTSAEKSTSTVAYGNNIYLM